MTATTAFLATVNLAMPLLDLRFCSTREARVGYFFSSGEHSKGLHSQIKTDGFLTGMEGQRRVKFILRCKDGKPLVPLSFDGTRFDLTLDLSMELDLNVTNFGEVQSVPNDLIATLGIGEAMIAFATLETRIAWGFAILNTTEEGIKGFIKPSKHILLHLRVDILVLFSHLFDLGKLSRLHVIEDRDSTHLIGVSTLLQSCIVQLFAAAQRPFQRPDLFPGRIQAKLVRLRPQVRASRRLCRRLLRLCVLFRLLGHRLFAFLQAFYMLFKSVDDLAVSRSLIL